MLRQFDGPRGSYTLRLATTEDAGLLAHHRASMFQDMQEVDEQEARVSLHASVEGRPLYEGLGFEPTNEMRLGLT